MTTELSFLKTFTSGNTDKMKKYINMFLQACPDNLHTLTYMMHAKDYNGIRATVHALKPQLTYMGLHAAEVLAKEIENDTAALTQLDQLPQKVESFKTLCETGINDLKETLATL